MYHPFLHIFGCIVQWSSSVHNIYSFNQVRILDDVERLGVRGAATEHGVPPSCVAEWHKNEDAIRQSARKKVYPILSTFHSTLQHGFCLFIHRVQR